MRIEEFKVDTIRKFINNVIKLTQYNKIKWDIIPMEYDYSKLSQLSSCIRFVCKWNNNTFVIISQGNKFNFEVKFKDNPDITKNLPLSDEDTIQKSLEQLFLAINDQSETYSKFNNLFDNILHSAIFLD